MRKWLPAAIGVFILGYMLAFAWPGIFASFSGDDLMNLHGHLQAGAPKLLKSVVMYWSNEYRPLGGLFYVAMYRVFGFHPLPYRIACFGLVALNLLLLYRFGSLLSGSREVGVLSALIACYHAWFVDLYYSTGTIYELLCYAFYFAALTFYIRIREAGRGLRPRDWAVLLALYICALDSKELAVTLPIAIGAYELLYWRRKARFPAMLVTAAMTLPYVLSKLSGGALARTPEYHPVISWHQFLHAFRLYTNVLFYQDWLFRSGTTALLLVVMLELALLARSRTMGYGWCFLLFSVLPFIFLPHYSGFFLYLPMAGWALFGAQALVEARRAVLRRPHSRALVQAATFAAVALVLAPFHARQTPKTMHVFSGAQPPSRLVSAELAALEPAVPKAAHVVFVNDRQPDQSYWLLFLVRLYYHDLGIEVARTAAATPPPGRWDVVFAWDGMRLRKVRGS